MQHPEEVLWAASLSPESGANGNWSGGSCAHLMVVTQKCCMTEATLK